MNKLFESKIQKVILLIGAIVITIQLWSSPYEASTTIFRVIGTIVIVVVLLIITKDYHPSISKIWFFMKRNKKTALIFVIFLLVCGSLYGLYRHKQRLAYQDFHLSEVAYQNCLDKVASISRTENSLEGEYSALEMLSFGERYRKDKNGKIKLPPFESSISMRVNQYFDAWKNQGSPYYNQQAGHWEWAFMQWMMQNNQDFCQEFDPNLINNFLDSVKK